MSLEDKLEAVHRAITDEDREAVFHFRYQVYVEELKRAYQGQDSERRRLHDEEDNAEDAVLFYTGTVDNITSAARVRTWAPGGIPELNYNRLSLDRFEGIDKLNVAEVTRLMIRPNVRGKFLLPSLIIRGYEYLAGETGTDLAFFQCIPGLVHHFRKLGARPYGGALIEGGSSTLVPSVLVLSDYNYLRECGSFLAPYLKKYFFGPGRRRPLDTSAFEHVMLGHMVPLELDSLKIWDEIQDQLMQNENELPSFLDSLPTEAVRHIAAGGFLLKVSAGDVLTKKGTMEREMYLVLDGNFAVTSGNDHINTLVKGDLFGEIAFYLRSGERTASVKALTPGRVLVINHNFLKKLIHTDPDAAWQIMMNIGRIMAERLASMLSSAAGRAA